MGRWREGTENIWGQQGTDVEERLDGRNSGRLPQVDSSLMEPGEAVTLPCRPRLLGDWLTDARSLAVWKGTRSPEAELTLLTLLPCSLLRVSGRSQLLRETDRTG